MSKQFLTQHLNQVFSHMEKRDAIKAERSAIKENEVFKLRQEAVAKERIAQDQSRQNKIIQQKLQAERAQLDQEKAELDQEKAELDQEKAEHENLISGIIIDEVNETPEGSSLLGDDVD